MFKFDVSNNCDHSRGDYIKTRVSLDSKLNMWQHVSRVCKSANYYLHCIRKIRNFISVNVCKLLVHSLVRVRLDYCNALLCGAREDVIRQLERLQRQAARVVCNKYKNDHNCVTELMWVCIGCQYVHVFSTKYCSLSTKRSLVALQHISLI